ncbi:MAG: hypothetical protein ACKOPN_10885 [Prochlorococcaceae cyanobacterium]
MNAGRRVVDGVAGTRPGGRGSRGGIGEVGRWVGSKLEWLMDDDDDWREPWQERPSGAAAPPSGGGGRRPLEGIARRGAAAAPEPWPDDGVFNVPRWQRPAEPGRQPGNEPGPAADGWADGAPPQRPMPRSSRRRNPWLT